MGATSQWGEPMRQARVRSTGAGAAALLLALAWLVAPIEACLAAVTGAQATAPACAGCEGGTERAALSLDGGCEPAAACTMRAPAPCRDGAQALPQGGQAQTVAAAAAGFRLPVTDPHGAPVPPEPPPPDAEPQYLLCCSFLI